MSPFRSAAKAEAAPGSKAVHASNLTFRPILPRRSLLQMFREWWCNHDLFDDRFAWSGESEEFVLVGRGEWGYRRITKFKTCKRCGATRYEFGRYPQNNDNFILEERS